MSSQEPESQIVPLLHESEPLVPSSTPIPDPKVFQQAYNHHSEGRSGEEEIDQQHADFQPHSYGSRVEETQFQSIELDTQTVEDPSSPAVRQTSQLREDAKISMAPLGAPSQTTQLLSRPDVDVNADAAAGFTFAVAGKPSIGKFNRPPVPAKPKQVAEQSSEQGRTSGTTRSLPLKVTVSVQPNTSSSPTPLGETSLSNTMMETRTRTSGDVDGECAQDSPRQEPLSIPVAAHDPQTPISEASSGRSAQKSSNKSHRRIKKPFPEVASPPSNRRPHGHLSMTNRPHLKSPLIQANYKFEAIPLGIFANTGQTRTLSPSIDEINRNTRQQQYISPVLDASHGDSLRVSDRPSDLTAQEQHQFPVLSTRRASDPLHHRHSAWSLNEQKISSEALHPFESGAKESHPAQVVQEQREPLNFMDAIQGNSDGSSKPIACEKAMVQQDPYNNDLQEEVSKGPYKENERNALEGAHLAGPQAAGLSEVENRFVVAIASRIPSRAPSEDQSRPQSRRSNYGKPIMRPISLQDLSPQGFSESIAQRGPHSTKIKKSSNASRNPTLSVVSAQSTGTGQVRQKPWPTPGFFDDYKKFLANGQEYLEVMQDYERQSQLVKSQKSEIEKLRDISDSSIKQIQELESEKRDMTEKLKKFTELSSKYKKHMNEVVKAQKYLKFQASEIEKKVNEAIEARNTKEAVLQKLKSAIMDAKSLRVPAEKFAHISKQNRELEATNKKLVSENQKFESSVEELRKDNEKLTLDNNKLQIDFGAATKMCKLLQADIEKRLMELSCEKHRVEQLEKAKGDPSNSHEELLEFLKKIPKQVAEEFNKEEGLLAKVLELGKTTQAKVDEVALLSSNDKNQEAETSAAQIKLIEDLFSRFETSMQATNNDATARLESNNKILKDFKISVAQLRLDKEAEIQLNNRIFELGQINEALAIDKNTRERERQRFTKQLDELEHDLADCRGQLSAKKDELATALAASKEDPQLRAQIHDLETANNAVASQLQGSNQEIAKLKEELRLFQESAHLRDQKIKDWEHRFNDAQLRIKNLNEEKNNCLANKQQEIEKACQEARHNIAKSAEASKATLKMKLESEVNHLEQRVKQKDAELALAKEELQRARDESDAHGNNANILQGELALYKEQFIRQIAQLKRLEEQNPGRETSDRLAENLQSLRSECAELRNHIESIRSENSQSIEAAVRGKQAIEGNQHKIDALENEIEKLKKDNAELQKRLESLNETYNHQNALQSGHGDERRSIGGSKNPNSTTPLGMVRPTQQTQKLTQDPTSSSANSKRLGFYSIGTNDITLASHGIGTPEDALRKAARGVGSHRASSQIAQAAQTSSVEVVDNFETPQIRNHKVSEGPVPFNSLHIDSSSTPQPQRQGSGTRSLRAAGRKYSEFGQGNGTSTGPHHLSCTETVPQGVQTVYTCNDNSHDPDATASQGSLRITPFSEVASNVPTPSPLTDLSSMMDELGSGPNQEQLSEGYEKVGGSNKSEAPIKNANAPRIIGLQTSAQLTMDPLEENEVVEVSAMPKAQGCRNPPSTTEEAIRRRTAQPPKSAIKKPTLAGDAESTFAPKPVATITQTKTSVRAKRKDPSQLQDRLRGSYNRAVSGGKPQTPMAGIPPVANESSIGTFSGKQHSPQNIPLPKRNVPKRSASLIAQTQQPSKRVRTSKAVTFANGDAFPDSQENMQSS